MVKGLRFIYLAGSGKYYLSEPPVPLETIEPLSITGIKNLLYEIELSGKEIKDYLEYSYEGWFNQMTNPIKELYVARQMSDPNNGCRTEGVMPRTIRPRSISRELERRSYRGC